jgi:hypothetical protein
VCRFAFPYVPAVCRCRTIDPMGYRLLAAPWWIRWLVYGFLFAAIELVLAPLLLTDMLRNWGWPALAGFLVAGGMAFGGLVTAVTQPAHDAYRAAVAGLSRDDRARAAAALRTGDVPPDPEVRAVAIQLGENYLNRSTGTNRRLVLTVVLAGLFLVLSALGFAGGDVRVGGLWIAVAVIMVGAALQEGIRRNSMQHNVESLRQGLDAP